MQIRKPILEQWPSWPDKLSDDDAGLMKLMSSMKHEVYLPFDRIESIGEYPSSGMHYLINGEIRFSTFGGELTHKLLRIDTGAARLNRSKSSRAESSGSRPSVFRLSSLGFAPRKVNSSKSDGPQNCWFSEECLLSKFRTSDDSSELHATVQRMMRTSGGGKSLCDVEAVAFSECYIIDASTWDKIAAQHLEKEAQRDVYLSIAAGYVAFSTRVGKRNATGTISTTVVPKIRVALEIKMLCRFNIFRSRSASGSHLPTALCLCRVIALNAPIVPAALYAIRILHTAFSGNVSLHSFSFSMDLLFLIAYFSTTSRRICILSRTSLMSHL